MTHYDVLIIGGGQAGIPLAHALANGGKKVALAERKDLGGSCVNFGCTPTKAVIASARAAFQARRGAVFGLRVPSVAVDFPAVIDLVHMTGRTHPEINSELNRKVGVKRISIATVRQLERRLELARTMLRGR